jgi:hypothetical protein
MRQWRTSAGKGSSDIRICLDCSILNVLIKSCVWICIHFSFSMHETCDSNCTAQLCIFLMCVAPFMSRIAHWTLHYNLLVVASSLYCIQNKANGVIVSCHVRLFSSNNAHASWPIFMKSHLKTTPLEIAQLLLLYYLTIGCWKQN